MRNDFELENDQYLKFVLNERFFNPWKEAGKEKFDSSHSLWRESHLELYITNDCNQKCEYCYLQKYHDELYPNKVNNPTLILKNLNILLNYIKSNHFYIDTLDLFSGEIWQTQFGWDVLQTIYNFCKQGIKFGKIIIASNYSFLLEDKSLFKIQNFIDSFTEIGIPIIFSASVDGKIIEEENRPLNNGLIKTDTFYNRFFSFVKHNGFGFHPMAAACTIEKWKDNYIWYKEQCQKFDIDFYKLMMILEVRNDDWTDEKIEAYCDFIEFYMRDYASVFPPEIRAKSVAESVFYPKENNFLSSSYLPFGFGESKTYIGCTCNDSLTVRLGDLAICPCHRLARKELLYGHFVVENDKIVNIESNNIYMANRILLANNDLTHLKCDSCVYNPFCIKGCYGSQYENEKDSFVPIPSVCKLLKAKMDRIIKVFEEMGVIDEIKKYPPSGIYYSYISKVLKFIEDVKNEKNLEYIQKKIEV